MVFVLLIWPSEAEADLTRKTWPLSTLCFEQLTFP